MLGTRQFLLSQRLTYVYEKEKERQRERESKGDKEQEKDSQREKERPLSNFLSWDSKVRMKAHAGQTHITLLPPRNLIMYNALSP